MKSQSEWIKRFSYLKILRKVYNKNGKRHTAGVGQQDKEYHCHWNTKTEKYISIFPKSV